MSGIFKLHHASIPIPPGGQDAGRKFFGELLGLREVIPPSTLDRSRLVWFQIGDGGHEIHLYVEEGQLHGSPGQHLCMQVDDLDEISARLSAAGVRVEDPDKIRNRPRVFIEDPFQNRIELTQINGDYV